MWFLQCALFVMFFINCVNPQNTYSIPSQEIIVTKDGFRISIPHEPGIETLFFHGNINKHVDFLDPNVVILSATDPIDGEWLLEHKRKGLKTGDYINYWIHLTKAGVGYTSRSIFYKIKDVLPDYPPPSGQPRTVTDDELYIYNLFNLDEQTDENFSPDQGIASSTQPALTFDTPKTDGESDNDLLSTKHVSSTTQQSLSSNEMREIINIFGPNQQLDDITTPESIPRKVSDTEIQSQNYQWIWPDQFSTSTDRLLTKDPEIKGPSENYQWLWPKD